MILRDEEVKKFLSEAEEFSANSSKIPMISSADQKLLIVTATTTESPLTPEVVVVEEEEELIPVGGNGTDLL